MNNITIDGRLGGDPEEFVSVHNNNSSDKRVVKFKLASNYKKRNQQEAETTWFNVICFGSVADGAISLKKGDRVFVEGRFETRKFTKKDGTDGWHSQVVANGVYISVDNKKKEVSKQNENDDLWNEGIPF
jgi:single-strand DNA-binding protein